MEADGFQNPFERTKSMSASDKNNASARRYGLPILTAIGILLWVIFAPHFLSRENTVDIGAGCYVPGYRDPVTGRSVTLDPKVKDCSINRP